MDTQNHNKETKRKSLSFLIPGCHITNSNIWVMDETFFSKEICVMLVIGLKTTAILGTCWNKVSNATQSPRIAFNDSETIEELYNQIINEGNKIPQIVHTDRKAEYIQKNIVSFFSTYDIKHSVSGRNENQLAESTNNQIKSLVVDYVYDNYNNNSAYRAFHASLDSAIKVMTPKQRRRSKLYRDALFKSEFFLTHVDFYTALQHAVNSYNSKSSRVSDTGYDRDVINKLNNVIESPLHILQGEKNSVYGQLIKASNDLSYREAANQVVNIIQQNVSDQDKIEMLQNLIILEEDINSQAQKNIIKALIFIANQNQHQITQICKVIQQNNQMSKQNTEILQQNKELNDKIDILVTEKEKLEALQKAKEIAREKRKNRILRPKTEPLTYEKFLQLMNYIKGKSLIHARLRCAFTFLAVTGIRFQELRMLKYFQVNTLMTKYYCPIDRKKRGPSNFKAFLRKEGINIIKERQKDFDRIVQHFFECGVDNEKQMENFFIFSPKNNPNSPISRSYFNRELNNCLSLFSNTLDCDTTFSTHSFRHNFITELWKDSHDLEFVRQFMGHRHIQSTAAYVQTLTDAERVLKLKIADENKQNRKLAKKDKVQNYFVGGIM